MSKAAETRLAILQKAFELIYVRGYQATSVDDIIATTAVTKGAFYYHFKNKDEMGIAVINELMLPFMYGPSVQALEKESDPVTDIYGMMKYLLIDSPYLQVRYGCPAGNLTQEMSPLNDEFSKALAHLVGLLHSAIQKNIANGKKAGSIRTDVNGQQVAYMIMSGYWGIRNFGKLQDSKACFTPYLKELKNYLKSLQ